MKGCDVGQHGVGAHIGGGALNSRPLPMKHLVICILSLAALIRHSIHPLYSLAGMRVYTASLSTVVRGLGARHNGKRGKPTCKCAD